MSTYSRILMALAVLSVVTWQARSAEPIIEVVPRADIRFQPLNPARGDAAPKAGGLWGDIRRDVASGALIEFAEGFSSPPHIHNITYRAVVIGGEVHNDDPAAERLWMEPGSFWTQPAGEVHITAAASKGNAVAFLEILSGPYLVQSADNAFDNGERPLNLEARNVVWLDASDTRWVEATQDPASGPRLAFLWGSPTEAEAIGTFLQLPGDASGKLRGGDAWLRAVVVRGMIDHTGNGSSGKTRLEPGSYFGSKGKAVHDVECNTRTGCQLYIRTEGRYRFVAD